MMAKKFACLLASLMLLAACDLIAPTQLSGLRFAPLPGHTLADVQPRANRVTYAKQESPTRTTAVKIWYEGAAPNSTPEEFMEMVRSYTNKPVAGYETKQEDVSPYAQFGTYSAVAHRVLEGKEGESTVFINRYDYVFKHPYNQAITVFVQYSESYSPGELRSSQVKDNNNAYMATIVPVPFSTLGL